MVRKISDKPAEAPKPAATPAPASAANVGQPTQLASMGSCGIAKPATYKLKIDNQSYFVEVEQLG
jgi:hypothetical protein